MDRFVQIVARHNRRGQREAMDQSALSKWLHTPRADGRPKLLQCFVLAEQMLAVKLDELKQLYHSDAHNSPAFCYDHIQFALFVNERTREQLTFGYVDNNQCLVKRSPIDRDEKQWAKWEQEASEAWNRNNVIGIMI
uniref:Uncharacterized protein n=1 Tax=Globodera rostochiensis TaxID=31243 RepID=A0A914HE31_GLORO